MIQQIFNRRLLVLLCAVVGLAIVGIPPAAADELPGDGGSGDACTQHTSDAYDAIDAVEASLLANDGVAETEGIVQVQAIVSQLNSDLSRIECSAG